jgi:hypothetical protein
VRIQTGWSSCHQFGAKTLAKGEMLHVQRDIDRQPAYIGLAMVRPFRDRDMIVPPLFPKHYGCRPRSFRGLWEVCAWRPIRRKEAVFLGLPVLCEIEDIILYFPAAIQIAIVGYHFIL